MNRMTDFAIFKYWNDQLFLIKIIEVKSIIAYNHTLARIKIITWGSFMNIFGIDFLINNRRII